MREFRELHCDEIGEISGGDWQTWNWGRMLGSALGSAWGAMKEYAASPDSSTDVIV